MNTANNMSPFQLGPKEAACSWQSWINATGSLGSPLSPPSLSPTRSPGHAKGPNSIAVQDLFKPSSQERPPTHQQCGLQLPLGTDSFSHYPPICTTVVDDHDDGGSDNGGTKLFLKH